MVLHHSEYINSLSAVNHDCYTKKLQACHGLDPYEIDRKSCEKDWNLFPKILHGDILHYLVYSTNSLTLQQMKAFKSLESHNYFTSGWVNPLIHLKIINNELKLMLGEDAMNNDPGILCYQHTKDESKVFCFEFPHTCKFCNADLLNSELKIPPFRVPYPFKKATKEHNAVVIKPTFGDFLNNYNNSADLHIGVTDSEGFVIEYDSNGLRRSKAQNWEQCLTINIVQSMTSSLQCYWDEILYKTSRENCWTPERYSAENHNCYSFVMSFLRSLQLEKLHPYLTDKVVFCKYFISPQARIAARYISLYRQLKRDLV